MHTSETKLAISLKKSKGSVYIYNEFKQLLVIVPSMTSLAILLGSRSISVAIKSSIKEGSLFRSSLPPPLGGRDDQRALRAADLQDTLRMNL